MTPEFIKFDKKLLNIDRNNNLFLFIILRWKHFGMNWPHIMIPYLALVVDWMTLPNEKKMKESCSSLWDWMNPMPLRHMQGPCFGASTRKENWCSLFREPNTGHHAMQLTNLHQMTQVNLSRCKKMRLYESNSSAAIVRDRNNHLVDCCFYLHGFLVGHKLHGKNVKPKKPVAHNIPTNIVEPIKWPTTGATTLGIIRFTCNNAQYGSHSTLHWIVDSGATNHMS